MTLNFAFDILALLYKELGAYSISELLEFPQFYPQNLIYIDIIINDFQKMPKI